MTVQIRSKKRPNFYSIISHTLFFILIAQVCNIYYDFSHTIKNIPTLFRLQFLKIADLTCPYCFLFENLLSHCADIEENP